MIADQSFPLICPTISNLGSSGELRGFPIARVLPKRLCINEINTVFVLVGPAFLLIEFKLHLYIGSIPLLYLFVNAANVPTGRFGPLRRIGRTSTIGRGGYQGFSSALPPSAEAPG